METIEELIREAKRIEEDSIHSAKAHFCAAHRWSRVHLCLGIVATVFSVIVAVSSQLEFNYHDLVISILSIIVATLTALITFAAPQERASRHLRAGNKYNSLRNDSRIFFKVDMENLDDKKSYKIFKKLYHRSNELNLESPQIPQGF